MDAASYVWFFVLVIFACVLCALMDWSSYMPATIIIPMWALVMAAREHHKSKEG